MKHLENDAEPKPLTLVLTATGKTGRRVADRLEERGVPIRRGSRSAEIPFDYIELLNYFFATVLDGRNAHVTDGVEHALGRTPRDFREYTRDAAATGVWHGAALGA